MLLQHRLRHHAQDIHAAALQHHRADMPGLGDVLPGIKPIPDPFGGAARARSHRSARPAPRRRPRSSCRPGRSPGCSRLCFEAHLGDHVVVEIFLPRPMPPIYSAKFGPDRVAAGRHVRPILARTNGAVSKPCHRLAGFPAALQRRPGHHIRRIRRKEYRQVAVGDFARHAQTRPA